MSDQIPDHNELKDLNSDSSLPNAEFVERHLLHSVFANPVVHRGSNDHAFPRAPTPGDVRMMFGTNASYNGQPEYSFSPITMVDPTEWRSVIDSNVQFANQTCQDLDQWLHSNVNELPSSSKTQDGQDIEDFNYSNHTSITPKNSDSSFNLEDFIKKSQSDEEKIKKEIEKIFAPFSETHAGNTDKKEVVGKILQNLISKFGLLRIYTTLKLVEDELNLQSKDKEDAQIDFNTVETDIAHKSQTGKCIITEISSNESVMTRKSADILHALFLKNSDSSEPSLFTTMNSEKQDDIFVNSSSQEQSNKDLSNLTCKGPASDFSSVLNDNVNNTLQCLLSDATISEEGALKLSLIPVNEKLKVSKSSSTKHLNKNMQNQRSQEEHKTNLSSKDPSKAVVKVNNEQENLNKAWLTIYSDSQRLRPRLSKVHSGVKNKSSKNEGALKEDPKSQIPEWNSWSNRSTGLTERAKLALLKRRINGKTKVEKIENERNYTHLPDRIKQSRLKLRNQNQAYFISRGQTSSTSVKTCSDKHTGYKQNHNCKGLKISERQEKTKETISGICKSNLKESIAFGKNCSCDTFSPENMTLVNEEEDLACNSCNNSLVNYKSQNKISVLTESLIVSSPMKNSTKIMFVGVMILIAIGVGYMCYIETGISLVRSNAYQIANSIWNIFSN